MQAALTFPFKRETNTQKLLWGVYQLSVGRVVKTSHVDLFYKFRRRYTLQFLVADFYIRGENFSVFFKYFK